MTSLQKKYGIKISATKNNLINSLKAYQLIVNVDIGLLEKRHYRLEKCLEEY